MNEKMQFTPEMKTQLQVQKEQCVFCKIVQKEIPAQIVYEDAYVMILLDIYPAVKGHCLVLLKEHYPILPYVPKEEFEWLFGGLPRAVASVKKAMLATGMNVFLANGAAAGQQSPHFLLHLLPRDGEDKFFNFMFRKKMQAVKDEEKRFLQHSVPQLMAQHFQQFPAAWHTGKGNVPGFLTEKYEQDEVLYEDEKLVVFLPKESIAPGGLEIRSKEEQFLFEKLSTESCIHVIHVASQLASLLFQGLQAQGTNIVVLSGKTEEYLSGELVVHILPRKQEDALQSMHWQSQQPKYDLAEVAEKIKDKLSEITFQKKETKIVQKPLLEEKKITVSVSTSDVSREEIHKAILLARGG